MLVNAHAILVKAGGDLPRVQLAFGAAQVAFTAAPLFKSIGPAPRLGAAAASTWQILTPEPGFVLENPWDLCHSLMQQGLGVAGAAPEFAEPDLEQKWLTGDESQLGMALARPCDQLEEQSENFPHVAGKPYWFRDTAHSQFDDAVVAVGGPDVASKVRIAHFDTGYDPKHRSRPKRLRTDLARNFIDDGNPDDASDQTSGLLTNLGHGTGTLSILAGMAQPKQPLLGGAPFAEIVPLRVANRVVLFKNSAIARAFDYVHSLNAKADTPIDIISMSMGGLASQAWAEAVNALYEQGVFIVTAAGNNFGNLPTRNIVYPARFGRVVAACGVMANGQPYADLDIRLMAGNYGPEDKMKTAIAAPTPNVPWARLGCSAVIDFNGQGTSAATPQVAAAAALWLQQHRAAVDAYPSAWMRVEAIRTALFESAEGNASERRRLGCGELRANSALANRPVAPSMLRPTDPDSASFAFLRVLTGLGLQAAPAQQGMLELEALQLSQSALVEGVMPEDPAHATAAQRRQVAEALAAHPRASQALRQALDRMTAGAQISRLVHPQSAKVNTVGNLHLNLALAGRLPKPGYRPLRVYAYDPSVGSKLETLEINEAVLNVRWEDDLQPGPIGEYLEVIDVDPASQCCYAPVDLGNRYVLAQSGIPPSEANPQFHQQMAYAVAMKTIEHFERALGRVALWAPRERRNEAAQVVATKFVQRLRIYPHALRAKNAYYSPDRKALLLGYFTTTTESVGGILPGGVVFTAVSHDIIAHETTHALLHGLHLRSIEPTNADVFAFHEAFADIVALFQHFTLPEALRHQIALTRGDLEKQNLLGQLAIQFGQATDRYGALRDYIGQIVKPDTSRNPSGDDQKPDETISWKRITAKRTDYDSATEPHARGAVLVSAVFSAFLQIYKRRNADLLRIATGGSGVLPEGAISVDLVNRLACEASKVAGHVLNMCIRALDYCPPADLTFGEYIRALITADADLVPDDRHGYRTAFIAAFRERGIYPRDVKNLSPDSLLWEPPPSPLRQERLEAILAEMSLNWDLNSDRRTAYESSRRNAAQFWKWLMDPDQVSDRELANLGLERTECPEMRVIDGVRGELRRIEVHSIRPARRVGPKGNLRSDIVVEITQTFRPEDAPGIRIRSGSTLLIDYATFQIRYLIRKKLRISDALKYRIESRSTADFTLRANYFSDEPHGHEPFALLHQVYK